MRFALEGRCRKCMGWKTVMSRVLCRNCNGGRVVRCSIIRRVNRFIVLVNVSGERVEAHITNTGSLRGVLVEGREGYCVPREGGRTRFRLIAVECPGYGAAALIDTFLQMKAFELAVMKRLLSWMTDCSLVTRNPRVESSRLDYLFRCRGRTVFVEVKSAVLRLDDKAAYPEPASKRGRRHVRLLAKLASEGHRALLVFMAALPGVNGFKLNTVADPFLPRVVERAVESGVEVRAISLHYWGVKDSIVLDNPNLPIEI